MPPRRPTEAHDDGRISISNDLLVQKILDTSDKVASIDTSLAEFLKQQTRVENKLDDHGDRLGKLEKARYGDRRFIAGTVVILSPIAAAAIAFAKQFFGL
jgi:hypothetical protein